MVTNNFGIREMSAKTWTVIVVIAMAYAPGWNSACGEPIGNSDEAIVKRYVSFDDIAPAGLVLEQCWNAMGMDAQERVYIGFTSRRPDGREDFAVFRYDPGTAERLFLGTFIDASQVVGNVLPREEIPKGHTRMLQIGEKMYMGSQSFHDFKGAIDTLPSYRGAHLYAYDLDSGKLEDVSASLPGGVVIKHQGVVALSDLQGYNLLVALAHPSSDIILFDYKENKVREIVPGIPWRLGNPLSREVIATKEGQIYTYRGAEEPAERGAVNNIWAFDLNTHAMNRTTYTASYLARLLMVVPGPRTRARITKILVQSAGIVDPSAVASSGLRTVSRLFQPVFLRTSSSRAALERANLDPRQPDHLYIDCQRGTLQIGCRERNLHASGSFSA